ncbi:MaoC family dehydratase [Amycolatopsis jejuensis]|uniref:MaoC family dehydratase n=1 Tax=Amycolatopsis jejuensis TaxID=330084 RepID=UPI000525571B|nr:MaoC family dehydratase [Amycolatopsis jejuensis]
MPEPDLDAFPVRMRGRKFEDFADGQVLHHHWGRTLTAADNVVFSTATCTWLPLYLNAEFARAAGHPEPPVNPMLVLATVIGLSVEDLSEAGGPFLGVDDCEFRRPVYPGDTLTASSTVLSMRASASRPEGIVTWRTRAHNQRGDLVLHLTRTNLVAHRSPA